jgi:hypothetical protein
MCVCVLSSGAHCGTARLAYISCGGGQGRLLLQSMCSIHGANPVAGQTLLCALAVLPLLQVLNRVSTASRMLLPRHLWAHACSSSRASAR